MVGSAEESKMKKHLDAFDMDQLQKVALKETAAVSEQDREDAMQEFMLGALEAQAKAGEGQAVRTYQWECGRGRVLNYLNRDKHGRNQEKRVKVILDLPVGDEEEDRVSDLIPASTMTPADIAAGREQANKVQRAVKRLPPELREIVVARFFDGSTLEEVAKRRKVSKQAIQQAEARALKSLRNTLKHLAA